jgi:hypothetical protein
MEKASIGTIAVFVLTSRQEWITRTSPGLNYFLYINATKASNQALSNFDLEMERYNRLVAEGIHKASDWERNR